MFLGLGHHILVVGKFSDGRDDDIRWPDKKPGIFI